MTLFFFNVSENVYLPDTVGTELADIATARRMAVTACGEAIRELSDRIWENGEWSMHVTDGFGTSLFEFHFSGRMLPGGGTLPDC